MLKNMVYIVGIPVTSSLVKNSEQLLFLYNRVTVWKVGGIINEKNIT